MPPRHFRIHYHSLKMLMTVDLNTFVEVLLKDFGPSITLELHPMTDAEQAVAEESTGVATAVRIRFMLYEVHPPNELIRNKVLEDKIIHFGQK